MLGTLTAHLVIDVITASLARDQVAVIDQILIGQHHRIARYAKVFGHSATGRQWLAAAQLPAQNGINEGFADLCLQADILAALEMENGIAHAGSSCLPSRGLE